MENAVLKSLRIDASSSSCLLEAVMAFVDIDAETSHWNTICSNNKMSSNKILVEAVRTLTRGQEDAEADIENNKKGVTVSDIERWLVTQKYYLTKDEFKCPLHVSLQKEVSAGRLEKLTSGTFVLSAQQISKDKAMAIKQKALLKRSISTPGKRGRPSKKKQKMKQFQSPYDDEECPVDPPQPSDTLNEGNCDYCLQTAENNKRGEREEFLVCKDCSAKAHPTCMGYSILLSSRARLYPWQCIDCKTCCLCLDASDPDSMLFCDACDKGYHMNCHKPKVTDKPSGKWICSECADQGITDADLVEDTETKDTENKSGNTSCNYPTPCESPVTDPGPGCKVSNLFMLILAGEVIKKYLSFFKNASKENGHSSIPKIDNGKYPDASKWTTDDVVQFIISVGFKDQAEAFREQEIDGQSLLLMKRSDVLTGLDIRLGPALKIYQHVLKLQAVGLDNSLF
ncbi:unnamed protein product [Mytilus coruscus]|uniref:Uncharacterized protein n=1 Tax=Mytilus coruscus TaxID=42192 RepID=A0A6J8CKB3_MYTCO|nr:unnamed protein product [Mytilus coruscus]